MAKLTPISSSKSTGQQLRLLRASYLMHGGHRLTLSRSQLQLPRRKVVNILPVAKFIYRKIKYYLVFFKANSR